MLPTFEVLGDHLLISKLHRKGRGVEVGDIVSFDSVAEPGERVIKRVLGLPGDYVTKDTPETGSSEMIQVRPNLDLYITCHSPFPGSSRPLLGDRRQPTILTRLENVWTSSFGFD